jgi:Family of unknown function (DUF6463)
MLRDRTEAPRGRVSPGNALMLVGCGHVVWGLIGYHEPLKEIVRAGVHDSVGDGIFRTTHARDARAVAFWFLFSAPLMWLCGRLLETALEAEDSRAVSISGRTVAGLGALGMTVIPRSGFPSVVPIGLWAMRRGRLMRRHHHDH